jgi:hypothetical protein
MYIKFYCEIRLINYEEAEEKEEEEEKSVDSNQK